MSETGSTLYRTATGTSLHLPSCKHLQDTPVENRIAVAPGDQLELQVCTWSADELAGTGRRYFDTLDSAFEALPVPVDNRIRIREILAQLRFDLVWIPNGGQYIAVGLSGSVATAYVNRGFVDVRLPDGGYDRELFANYGGGSAGSGGPASPDLPVQVCPQCHVALPATGKCDDCDA